MHDHTTPDHAPNHAIPDHAASAREIARRQGLQAVESTDEKAPARAVLEQLLAGSTEAALVEAIVAAHAATHARDSYTWSQQLSELVVNAAGPHLPEVRIEIHDGDDETDDVVIINPRTGEHDDLVAVDTAIRHTTAEDVCTEDLGHRQVRFMYDDGADFEGLLYITESDQLPVRLPAGWTETTL